MEELILQNINYSLTIGSWTVNSAKDPRTELIELETSQSLETTDNVCTISIYAQPSPNPELPEHAQSAMTESAGQFGGSDEKLLSAEISGRKIKCDDRMIIELTSGDISDIVMTAQVQTVNSSFGKTAIIGLTGMQKLADTRLNQVYENQTLSLIIKDLALQAGVDVGTIEIGSKYSCFIVHESKNLLRHIRRLATLEGMDVYFDKDNKLTVKKLDKSGAVHTFYYGKDILDLQMFNHQMPSDHIIVCGESPASSLGSDTWHWLAKDIAPFHGESGDGGKTLRIKDCAVRTKDAADSLSVSKFGAIKDQSVWGRLSILGNPKVKLGDAIEIKNAQKPELNGVFKVTSVRHILNKHEGYLTIIGFTGLGGSNKAGGLLGGQDGKPPGALGSQ